MKNYRIDAIRDTLRSRSLLFPLDMVLVGATGVGKSSTINALFGKDVAVVGTGVDPETQYIQHYQVNNVFRIQRCDNGKARSSRLSFRILGSFYRS